MEENLKRYLESFLTPERYEGLHFSLNNRTDFITIVLEDLYDPLNANAVIRTMDGMGIQNLHLIESRNQFETNSKTARGALKWIDLHRYDSKLDCVRHLKSKGYKLVTTSPHATKNISEIEINKPIALVFGNERDGVSKELTDLSDEFVKIPMYGFVESFNISVSVAMSLQNLRIKLENSSLSFHLSESEKKELYEKWLMKSVHHADKLVKKWMDLNSSSVDK